MQLSKSDYMQYLRHPAWVWLKKHAPEKLPPIDHATAAIFATGHAFEPYAESLFEGGVALGFDSYESYRTLPARTTDALLRGGKTLFQTRFVWGDYNCLPDVIDVVGDMEIDLYEIKSSTGVHDEHMYDLAFQTAVIEGNGYTVRNIYVIHVNNQYVRHGDIDPHELTTTAEVTDTVRSLAEFTATTMPLALEVIKSDTMPDPNPIFLGKFGSKREWQAIYDALIGTEPPDYSEAAPTVLAHEIQHFLNEMKYPLYFLDYETMSSVVPYFDGHRPYQQVPMQYSLHVLDSPDAELHHREYLHRENSDPSGPLVAQLINDIGNEGSIITWNASFERSCNTTLGRLNPQHEETMMELNDRIVDLMVPFRPKNGWYIDPRFEGSASIKKVLPVVVPELSYKELDIQNGAAAQTLWTQAVLDGTLDDEKDKILSDLVKYCTLDTLAMVEIYRVLAMRSTD